MRDLTPGMQDFEEARHDIEQLPLLRDPQALALHALSRIEALVPSLEVLGQVRRRLLPERVNIAGSGAEAQPILRALQGIYQDGPPAYFTSLVAALQACADFGHHLPRTEAVRALRMTADGALEDPVAFESVIAQYSQAVLAAAQVAPRMDRGLFVMTAHQAKGKEFDAVVLADAMERFWPDNLENRRLFYVVVTRATRSLTIIAPDAGASPLVALCAG